MDKKIFVVIANTVMVHRNRNNTDWPMIADAVSDMEYSCSQAVATALHPQYPSS